MAEERMPLVGTRQIRIVGCADSKTLCPMNEEGWEYVGVNNLFLTMPPDKFKWDRWYEIHNISEENGLYKRRGNPVFRGQKVNDYLHDLGKLKCPVFMQKKWSVVPNSEVLPGQEIIQNLGNYLTNTIAWQTAHYLYEHLQAIRAGDTSKMLKRLEIYGVDMAVAQPITGNTDTNEYSLQKPSCEFWLGMAAGMGIQIYIPPEADLLKLRYLYGYEEPQEAAWTKKVKMMFHSIKQREMQHEQQEMIVRDKRMQYRGAAQATEEMLRIWDSGINKSEEI
jgi:hypothetical protein